MPGQSQPISKVLLDGLYDQESPLSQLRGCQHIMRIIWDNITLFWEEMIEIPVVPDLTDDDDDDDDSDDDDDDDDDEGTKSCFKLA